MTRRQQGMIDRCLCHRREDGVPIDPKVSTTPWCYGVFSSSKAESMPGTAAASS